MMNAPEATIIVSGNNLVVVVLVNMLRSQSKKRDSMRSSLYFAEIFWKFNKFRRRVCDRWK